MKENKSAGSESNANPLPSGLHVLLVDDSTPMRRRLAESVSAVRGVAAVRQAGDVPSGLELLGAQTPDVLVLDIELPGQSGLDLLRIVRRRGYAGVVIMFSNHDHPRLRQICAGLGANFYFHKLNEFDRVAEVCRELAERRAPQTGLSSGETKE